MNARYESAKAMYAALGVDTEKAMENLLLAVVLLW